ncbi:hypothetical protein DUNSADRAFT_12992 [Dunaliella salina]|uniref:RRM domain-containing protein n=1 Tax=Dunaliella salina TaxID=3046 RepID=A0ABQ7GAA9_DUNSA|nr:hypothetical protein DUNSADRAFT_12992 [Dunaliella salina]|eukprot:KAF5831546.1 hypothetical protein DUNSADRAFT_12992 [Dunaliella salina]
MPAENKVYVSNLPFSVDEQALEDAFKTGVGRSAVTGAEVIRNREGQPKGFGFVMLSDYEAMQQAIEKMHRTSLMGRDISVTRAIPKDQMPPRSDPDRRSSRAGGPGSRDFGGYNSYGRLSMGGYMPPSGPMVPMRRGGIEPLPIRGGPGGSRGGFRVYISGLPAHFTWRELKDFLRTGSPGVTYADVKRPGAGIGEWATPQERSMAIRALQGVAVEGCTVRIREDDDDLEPFAPPMAAAGMMGVPPMVPPRMSAYDDAPMYRGGPPYSRGMAPRAGYAARDPSYDDMRPAPLAPRASAPMRPSAYDMPLSSRDMAMGRDMALPPRGYGRMPIEPPVAAPYYPADVPSRYDRAPYSRSMSREPPARLGGYARPSSVAVPVRGAPSRYAPY